MAGSHPNVLLVGSRPHADRPAGRGDVPSPFDGLSDGFRISRGQALAAGNVVDGQLDVRSKVDLKLRDVLEDQGARRYPEREVLRRWHGLHPLEDVVDVQGEFE